MQANIFIKDLGDEPQDRPDPRGVPSKGVPLPSGYESIEGGRMVVGIPAFGDGNGRNRGIGGGGILLPPP